MSAHIVSAVTMIKSHLCLMGEAYMQFAAQEIMPRWDRHIKSSMADLYAYIVGREGLHRNDNSLT
jgi:hypothetical protein